MGDIDRRIQMYEQMFHRVAADYSPMPLMVDDRFIRAVAMAFAELDARVERVMQAAERKDALLVELQTKVAKLERAQIANLWRGVGDDGR